MPLKCEKGWARTYLLVEIRLKFASNRHSIFLALQREHGWGVVLRVSQASLTCLHPVQLLARLATGLYGSAFMVTTHCYS